MRKVAYLFICITAIILIPILYVVPMGLSLKGKHLVASSTFLFSMVGAAASATYPLWMILLMLGVTVCLMAYLIDQRISGLFSSLVPAGDGAIAGILNDVKEPGKTDPIIHSVKEETREETEAVSEMAATVEFQQPLEVEDDESEWFVESVNEGIEPETSVLDEELELEEDELMLGSWFENAEPAEGSEEDPELMFIQPVEPPLQDVQEDDTIATYMEELFEEGNSAYEQEDGQLPVSVPGLEDLSNEIIKEEPLVIEEETGGILEEDRVDASPEEENHLLLEESIEDNPSHEEWEDLQEEPVSRPRIDGPIMKTMLEIIALSETSLQEEAFQELVNSYLHPDLHDRDYYTFAKILIDYHLAHAQFEKCSTFITGIEDRFHSYGYLSEELSHIKQYAQNQMN